MWLYLKRLPDPDGFYEDLVLANKTSLPDVIDEGGEVICFVLQCGTRMTNLRPRGCSGLACMRRHGQD
jgi:hypothetical protein